MINFKISVIIFHSNDFAVFDWYICKMRAIYLRFDGIFDWIPGLSVVYLPGKEAACNEITTIWLVGVEAFSYLKTFFCENFLSYVKTFFCSKKIT